MQVYEDVRVPAELVPHVIGAGGRHLKRLWRKHRCRVTIKDNVARVQGTDEARQKFHDLLFRVFEKHADAH